MAFRRAVRSLTQSVRGNVISSRHSRHTTRLGYNGGEHPGAWHKLFAHTGGAIAVHTAGCPLGAQRGTRRRLAQARCNSQPESPFAPQDAPWLQCGEQPGASQTFPLHTRDPHWVFVVQAFPSGQAELLPQFT